MGPTSDQSEEGKNESNLLIPPTEQDEEGNDLNHLLVWARTGVKDDPGTLFLKGVQIAANEQSG